MGYLERPSPGNITEAFGPRPKPTPTSPPFHYGIDLGWGNGDVVTAARAGVVTSATAAGAYGNRIVIQHEPGVETWYCHLSSFAVSVGNRVAVGQRIGIQGSTGNVTAKHLHFELRLAGVAVDPMPYFTQPSVAAVRVALIERSFTMSPRVIKSKEVGRFMVADMIDYQELSSGTQASQEAHVWESPPGGPATGEPLVVEEADYDIIKGNIEKRAELHYSRQRDIGRA